MGMTKGCYSWLRIYVRCPSPPPPRMQWQPKKASLTTRSRVYRLRYTPWHGDIIKSASCNTILEDGTTIDARCVEAWDHVVKRSLLTPEEEREWMNGLNFPSSISWLRDAYLARLRGGMGCMTLLPLTAATLQRKRMMQRKNRCYRGCWSYKSTGSGSTRGILGDTSQSR